MNKIVIKERISYNAPPKKYYIIMEQVTPNGFYIMWGGLYVTIQKARKRIAKEGDECFAAYAIGRITGKGTL